MLSYLGVKRVSLEGVNEIPQRGQSIYRRVILEPKSETGCFTTLAPNCAIDGEMIANGTRADASYATILGIILGVKYR